MSLKHDAAEKDKYVEELEVKLRAAEAGETSTASAASRPVATGSESTTKLELLRTCVKSSESAAVTIGQQLDTYR